MSSLGAKKVKSKDGSHYIHLYPILSKGEPINLLEYANKIVSKRSSFGLVLYDWQGETMFDPQDKDYIDPQAELQELILD